MAGILSYMVGVGTCTPCLAFKGYTYSTSTGNYPGNSWVQIFTASGIFKTVGTKSVSYMVVG